MALSVCIFAARPAKCAAAMCFLASPIFRIESRLSHAEILMTRRGADAVALVGPYGAAAVGRGAP